MRKFLLFLSTLFVLTLIIPSCSSSKTYAELLQDEKDNIAQLIADSGYTIIPFNKDTLYNPKTRKLMKLDNGAYIAIISRGNTNPADSAVKNITEVTYRFKYGRVLTDADTTEYSNVLSAYPVEFVFGASSTAFASSSNPVCEAIQTPLNFHKFGLGSGAKIKLIIPAKISFTDYQSSVITIYFPELTYKFYE